MSYLVSGFAMRMSKRAANALGLTASGVEVPGGKGPKLVDLDEETQKNPMIINVDFPDQASDAQPALEGAPQDAPKEACAPSEDRIPAEGSLGAEGVVAEAPLEVVVAPSFSTRLASVGPRRPRMLDRLLLSSYVPL